MAYAGPPFPPEQYSIKNTSNGATETTPLTNGHVAIPIPESDQKPLADHFEDYIYQCFWPVAQAETRVGFDLLKRCFSTGQYSALPNEVDCEIAAINYDRGRPPQTSLCQAYGGYAVMAIAAGVGGLSAYLYVPTSAAAAVVIANYPVFESIKAFLKPNIQYSGPIANAGLNSELLMRMIGNMFKPKTHADKALASKTEYLSNFICGTTSMVWAIAAVSPLAYMDSLESRNDRELALSLAGAVASIPSFYVGARSAIRYLGSTRSPCCGSYWLKAAKAVLINHMNAELTALFSLKNKHERQEQANSIISKLWPEGNPNSENNPDLSEILPSLLSISNTANETLVKHDLGSSYLTWSITGLLTVCRIMSLFGFTVEAYRAGVEITGHSDSEPEVKAAGILSAILTACAQAGLSIKSIETIGRAASDIVASITEGKPISEQSQRYPVVYFLLFFIAYYIGLFSGGTSAKAASAALSKFDDTTRQVFEAVSFAMSGVVVNGYFCMQLFKRIMSFYGKQYGEKPDRQFALFTTGYRNIIEKISSLDVKQIREIFNDAKVKPHLQSLLQTYEWSNEDIQNALVAPITIQSLS